MKQIKSEKTFCGSHEGYLSRCHFAFQLLQFKSKSTPTSNLLTPNCVSTSKCLLSSKKRKTQKVEWYKKRHLRKWVILGVLQSKTIGKKKVKFNNILRLFNF